MKRFIFGLVLVAALIYCLNAYQLQNGKAAIISTAPLTNLLATVQPQHLLASAHTGASTDVLGSPSLSASFIDKVLVAYHSKAVGTGQALYQDSLQYGIDDAYALGFFYHESMFGTTGVARATLSLGNIRCSAGYTCIEGYRAYTSWQAGYEDWYKLIRGLYINQWHLSTVQQIVPVYAPASDGNNVAGYISAVENAVKVWRTGKVSL